MCEFRVFAANDLPYDLTDVEMTWISWRPGTATDDLVGSGAPNFYKFQNAMEF